MNCKQSTKTNYKDLTKGKVILAIIAIIISLTPFANYLFDSYSLPGVFGFKSLEHFLYAIGQPLAMLLFSVGILYLSKFSDNEFRKLVMIFSLPFIVTSVFNIIWVFWPQRDLSGETYYSTMLFVSASLTYAIWYIIKQESSLKQNIRDLINFIVIKGKKHVPEENKKGYVKDYFKTMKKL